MQNPPGPPQGNPPAATSGVDKRTGALLSYLATWVTGIIFLFVGKNDPDVKYHAAQSVVLFASLSILYFALGIASSFIGFLAIIQLILGFVIFIYWVICLWKAWTGNGARFEAPVLGSFLRPYIEQLMNAVN
jgi:uncharacterized membrane protein